MARIRVGTEVSVYFNDDRSAPYRMFGKFVQMDDEWLVIKGTVGDYIGKEYQIPRSQIKMLEVIGRGRTKFEDPEHWSEL